MQKGTKRWGAAGLVLAGALVALGVYKLARPRPELPSRAKEEDVPEKVTERWRGFAVANADVSTDPVPLPYSADGGRPGKVWVSPEVTRQQTDDAIEGWRQAIIDRNAEQVVALDQAFMALPGRYGPQLERLAQEDPDERIRAFSTRVLGKMKNVAVAGLFQRLLADKSPFVRQNAAWALGELVPLPRGRAAAQDVTAELRHAESSDPSPEVRAAATKTLKKLQ